MKNGLELALAPGLSLALGLAKALRADWHGHVPVDFQPPVGVPLQPQQKGLAPIQVPTPSVLQPDGWARVMVIAVVGSEARVVPL